MSLATNQDISPLSTRQDVLERTVLRKKSTALVAASAKTFFENCINAPGENECVKEYYEEHTHYGEAKGDAVKRSGDDNKSSATAQQKAILLRSLHAQLESLDTVKRILTSRNKASHSAMSALQQVQESVRRDIIDTACQSRI